MRRVGQNHSGGRTYAGTDYHELERETARVRNEKA